MTDAGWDLTKGVTVPDALYALTGYKSESWLSSTWKSSSPDLRIGDSFAKDVLGPKLGYPIVLVTKKEHSVKALKPDYSYQVVPVDNPDGKGRSYVHICSYLTVYQLLSHHALQLTDEQRPFI